LFRQKLGYLSFLTLPNKEEKMNKLGVLVSGGGTNLQSIIDSCKSGYIPNTSVAVVISNKKDAYALIRAKENNIDNIFLDRKLYPDSDSYYEIIIKELEKRKVNLVCLAGFLLKLSPNIIRRYEDRILNIHPALLPKFGGNGMYGHYVHEAVLKAGEKISGCTVHFVNEEYDRGKIILQRKVSVLENDTPDTLAKRVLVEEHKAYPEAIKLFFENKIKGGTEK